MVNEEKVILMTKLAAYEQGEGKKYTSIAGYFRTDYASSYLLSSVIAGTLAFAAILGIYVFYNFETIMEDIYVIDFMAYGRKMGSIYLIFMGIYLVLSYVIAMFRYKRARNSLRGYYTNLRKLERFN